ncbi:MAG: universal stress protein, partial [Myxococcota bacterium]|nr:universal stress protein [Myxococcota bacterium]
MRLLVCVDFSPLTERVLAEASVLARAANASIVLLGVARTETALISGGVAPPGMHRVVPEDASEHRKELDAYAEQLRADELDARAELRVTHGEVADTILEAIGDADATHVVIGSHGHGKLHELFVG